MSNVPSQAFLGSGKTAHEQRMGYLLGQVSWQGLLVFFMVIVLCAFKLLHHPGDSTVAAQVMITACLIVGTALTTTLPVFATERVRLELRGRGWVPQQAIAGSSDARTLGVQVPSVTMRAAQADKRVFLANTGEWVAQARSETRRVVFATARQPLSDGSLTGDGSRIS